VTCQAPQVADCGKSPDGAAPSCVCK
jgi:hypothetical protein